MQAKLVFLHTADWQLGKSFASIANDAKRFRLQEQRIQTIRGLSDGLAGSGAAFVLVAGDLFDSPHCTKATVSAACAAIGSLNVPVIVIPGNHDHGGPESIWEQEFFLREQRQLAPNHRIQALQRMLDLAAVRCLQIIVLTCTPADYSAFGAAELRRSS